MAPSNRSTPVRGQAIPQEQTLRVKVDDRGELLSQGLGAVSDSVLLTASPEFAHEPRNACD